MSAESDTAVADEKKLSTQLQARNIEAHTWNTLKNSCFPGAATASILMAVDYCIARKLDVLKKPCHIVPIQVKVGKGEYVWRDVILPGIYEYRITAHRTGLYLGHTKPEYGPQVGPEGYEAPEWCEMTFYRWSEKAKDKVAFPVRVYYREVVGLTKDGDVNTRWSKAPIQMLTKCTEAAGLREAFPDEIGGEPTMEEMIDQVVSEQGKRTTEPGMSRTESAKAALRAALEDRSKEPNPLAQLKTKPLADELAIGDAIGRELRDQRRLEESRQLKPARFKYDLAAAVQHLRAQKSSAELAQAWRDVRDDYEFSDREIPIDVEAIWRDLKEAWEMKEAKS